MASKSLETIIREKIKEYIDNGEFFGRKTVARNIQYDFDRERYYVTFYYGPDKNNRPIQKKKTYTDVGKAVKDLQMFEAEKVKNEVLLPNKITLKDYCDHWVENKAPDKKSTRKFYRNIIEVHIKPSFLGKKKIQDITINDINKFITQQKNREDKTLSQATIRHHRTALLTIFNSAVEEELISKNPVARSKPVIVKKKMVESFSFEEVVQIIEQSIHEPEPYRFIYPFAIYTGMSRGEICGLKWNRVNLKDTLLVVAESRTDEMHGTETGDVKSNSRIRVVDLIEDAVILLQLIQQTQQENKALFGEGYQSSDFVFTYPDGSVPYPRTISKNFKWFLEKHKIRELSFHTLRHTFGTFQRIVGASSYDIKELMGHSSITVAENSYIKSFAANMKPQMQKFQDYLHGTSDQADTTK